MKPTVLKFAWPDRSKLSKGAFEIVGILRRAGFESYVAGGAVRDAILKRPIKEIDIATSAAPAHVKRLFSRTIPTGEKHGTITVRFQATNYEVTTFRTEGAYQNHRRPGSVKFVKSAGIDAKRRDFTINALFFDPEKKVVIDYVNGIADISHKRIRMVGNADARIKEDALRMLRAVRFATVLEFEPAKETRKAIAMSAKLITKISGERVKQELDKIVQSPRASVGIGLLDIVGLLQFVLPEVKSLQGVGQPKNQHSEGDAYAHSVLALEKADLSWDTPTRYAVLFHDLGKARTRLVRDGKITFYNHQEAGAELAGKICQRLKFSRHDSKKVMWLITAHMVPNDFHLMRLATRRRWGLSAYFSDLLNVYLADAKASIPALGRQDFKPFREGEKILEEVSRQPQLSKALVSGTDVMRVLKIKPGPLVGKILKQIDEKKLGGELKNKTEARKFLESNKNNLKNL